MYISIYFYSVKDLNIALLQIYQDARWPDEFNQKTIFVTDKVNILIFHYTYSVRYSCWIFGIKMLAVYNDIIYSCILLMHLNLVHQARLDLISWFFLIQKMSSTYYYSILGKEALENHTQDPPCFYWLTLKAKIPK